MKKLMTGIIAATLTTTVLAETYTVSPYATLERKFEAETNHAAFGVSTLLPWEVVADGRFNTIDPNSDARFEIDTYELDISKAFTDNVTGFVKNDFDKEFNRSETIAGIRVTF